MNDDKTFQILPDFFYGSFKYALLLGTIPAETVETSLGPLLSNYFEVMLSLPADLRTDFENVLRIYPDVAARYGLHVKPSLNEALASLAGYPSRESRAGEVDQLLLAAEDQESFRTLGAPPTIEGHGFLTTQRGTPVYLQLSCSLSDELLRFEYKGSPKRIDVIISGFCVLSIESKKPHRILGLQDLQAILHTSGKGISIEVIEMD